MTAARLAAVLREFKPQDRVVAQDSSTGGTITWGDIVAVLETPADGHVRLDDVLHALEEGYHPQNPSTMHPRDFVGQRFGGPVWPEPAPDPEARDSGEEV